jgi:hypothetical protein
MKTDFFVTKTIKQDLYDGNALKCQNLVPEAVIENFSC